MGRLRDWSLQRDGHENTQVVYRLKHDQTHYPMDDQIHQPVASGEMQ